MPENTGTKWGGKKKNQASLRDCLCPHVHHECAKDFLVGSHSNCSISHELNAFPSPLLQFPSYYVVPNSQLFPFPPKTFGCICYVHITKSDCSKLDPKALKCIFLSYSVDQKGYKCYQPPTHRKFVSQNVIFF